MLEGLTRLVTLNRPPTEIMRDLVDILVVAFIIYRALLVLKGTRAMQMGIGFAAFGLLYVMARYAELATLMRVLDFVAPSAILIIVVVFQNDIRRALIRVGEKAWFSRGQDAQERVFDEVVAAATELARHRMGAIICIERDANVLEFVTNDGLLLDSLVTRELLVSLFVPESVNKTHDGAVLIRKDLRLARAGIFFPMPQSTKVSDPTLGSRHRAAIGITEETDAVLVVVSEERGTITLFADNSMAQNMDGPSLRQALEELLSGAPKDKRRTLLQRLRFGFGSKADAGAASTRQPASGKPASKSGSQGSKSIPPRASKDPATGSSGKHTALKGKPSGIKASSSAIKASPSAIKAGSSAIKASPSAIKASPSAIKASGKSGRHSAQKKETSRSGSFKAIKKDKETAKRDSVQEEPNLTPQTPRVSVPMRSAKDRKSAEPKRAEERETEEPPTRVSVSKPMTPTELPGSPAPNSNGDS